MSDLHPTTRHEVWSGTPKGSLDYRLTDLYAGRIRAYIPPGFQGLMVPHKGSDRVLCIPFGDIPLVGNGSLRALEPDDIAELLALFAMVSDTLPIFRPDRPRFEEQNKLLAKHGVGFTLEEGVFVVHRDTPAPADH